MARTEEPGAAGYVPGGASLPKLREAAQGCRGCGLYARATQAVLGEGSTAARLVLLGEQPGDQEDRQGRPFVGPAGRLLDQALAGAGIDRADAYTTNAVKHFKFREQRGGKRRIHDKPNRAEIRACRPWLLAELALLRPQVMVCLGATAAQAIFGPTFRISRERGVPLDCPPLSADGSAEDADRRPAVVVATVHPSAVLRAGDDREAAYAQLVADLVVAAGALR